MHPLAATLLITAAVVLGLMLLVWLASLARRDASIIDPVWGLGFVIVAWLAWSLNAPTYQRALLLVGLVDGVPKWRRRGIVAAV